MKVFLEKQNEHREIAFSGTVQDLLERLSLNPETVLVVRDGALLTLDRTLRDSDSVQLLSVISGG